jgi:RNA polymerase sigma-70 factor (ECF subfamily)
MGPLAAAFVAACPTASASDALEARLAAAIDHAARAWPQIDTSPADVAAALGRRAAADDPLAAISDDAAAELHLAIACARGDAAAIRGFEDRYMDAVPAALASMRLPPSTVDEVRQEVRRKLLVADDEATGARILDYAGAGTLRGLVGVVAARTALSLLRKKDLAAPAADELLDLADAAPDPAVQLLKARYRAAFRAAFEAAVAALEARDRNLLRLHYLGGVTLDQLASMYNVHRATAVRWLADVRRRVLAATRKALADDGVEASHLGGMMALIESQLDLSVHRLLASQR